VLEKDFVVDEAKEKDDKFFESYDARRVGKDCLGVINSIMVGLLENVLMKHASDAKGDVNAYDSNDQFEQFLLVDIL
jgi:hypothetical protein